MGLFDKKYCDICGEKIGLLGNRKLEDGNMCKECAKQISPHITNRREFSVGEMKQHLAQRADNKERLVTFNETSSFGSGTKLRIDDAQQLWLVSKSNSYKAENPDILTFDQVTGCTVRVEESKSEEYLDKPDGTHESYQPPRYTYDYDIIVTINVNTPWYSEIEFQVGDYSIDSKYSPEYKSAEAEANEIKNALLNVHGTIREAAVQAATPQKSVICPVCKAVVIPNARGICEYCRSSLS
jgi:uncharacterized CHY-type Zn-finger protein